MNLGENIKKYRKAKGLTLKQLGVLIGLSEQAISQYERNVREPSIKYLYKISKALNVNVNDLTGEKLTFFQEMLNLILKEGYTLETISEITEITLKELENIKNNKSGVSLNTYIKLGESLGLNKDKVIQCVMCDGLLDAFYNDKNNTPERNNMKKFLAEEPLALEEILVGVDEEDKEFITHMYHEGVLNYTDNSKNSANETTSEFRLYLNKIDSFEKLLRQCDYPVDKIKSHEITYLFNLTIDFIDGEFEKIVEKYNFIGDAKE